MDSEKLPAVELLGVFLSHDMEAMCNGGVLKQKKQRLVGS